MAITTSLKMRRAASVRSENTTYEEVYVAFDINGSGQIVASEANDILAALLSQHGVQLGTEFTDFPGCKCTELTPVCRDDSEIWDITVRYEIPTEEPIPDDFDTFIDQLSRNTSLTNPFGPEFSGGAILMEEFWARDLEGAPFINYAKKKIGNVPPISIPVQVDRVSVNERQKPNTSQVGTAEGRRLIADINYTSQTHTDHTSGVRTRYYRNTYEVWTHPYKDWSIFEALNAGWMQLVADNPPKWSNIIDPDTGEPITEQALLDALGKPLAPNAEPIYIPWRVKRVGTITIPFL